MAKTAIINKETQDLVGVAQSEGTAKLVYEGANLTAEQVDLVTAKNFTASDRYPTFKDMCMTQAERDEAAKKAQEKADADAKKAQEKEAKAKQKTEKAANKGEGKARTSVPTEGEYHIKKAFPATRADHPKMPIWEAIANNTTVEAAKAACPAENPKRMTSGVYTFNSEFRYFLQAGYVGMGPQPEVAPAEEAQAA